MSGCCDCGKTASEKNRAMYDAINKAVEYAKKEGKEYAIYQEAGEWKFIRADIALSEGIPFNQVVDQFYS